MGGDIDLRIIFGDIYLPFLLASTLLCFLSIRFENMKSYTYTVPDQIVHVNMVETNASRPVFFRNNFEDTKVLTSLNSIFSESRGYSFRMPKAGTAVLLIVSGGLDSTMLWFHLLHKYKLQVYPIFFRSAFMSKFDIPGERQSVQYFSTLFGKMFPNQSFPIQFKSLELNFSLTNKANISILKENWRIALSNARQNKSGYLSTYLLDYPTRFARYILSAYEHGLSLQAKGVQVSDIFIGVVPEDANIGREPTLTVLRSLNLFLCLVLGDWKWQVNAPIDKKGGFYFSKSNSIKVGVRHNLPLEKTWSCVRQFPVHCGFCNACRYRNTSFVAAGMQDKTAYLIPPQLKAWLKKFVLRLRLLLKNPNNQIRKDKPNTLQETGLIRSKIQIYNKSIIYLSPNTETFQSGSVFFVRNNKTEEVITLNETGKNIVNLLEKKKRWSLDSLIKKMSHTYPFIPKKTIITDTSKYIITLIEGGYIQKNS